MIKIGLTGGIASGKSTVSKAFTELGINVIDADVIAREVLILYPELLEKIRSTFGDHFFKEDGSLDRKALGNYIFKYSSERLKLDNIMLPPIKEEIFKRIDELEKSGIKICIVDAATLIEQGIHKQMDMNILVWVEKNTQIERLRKRDNISLEQAMNRINSQMSLEEKKKYVDFIIDNDKDLKYMREQVEEIMNVIKVYIK
ncbi:MAG: dephospho-CoA kinase [Clostridiales bacterium]|uniref:dephospho-CoA kinase n=1 Tax=Clostridium sp. N3C TaxID=1776758 RepID=UPI00092DF94E|nr:dephospho-CoA kinase [Clostridium sp. N3C]NLZ47236.1 dephospho-CoA kinase [Clostridiales bacterium]SCN21711.1 Dephospho-CoA kinase [Clostridium sp. N3C]